ncbi:MAG: recombinase family protein [Ruminiclostridium sp.]|nr:recombinase family protein [Ruminiclostridium sp.]
MKNTQPKKTALYCRLSVDDGRLGESVSIESQKILLVQYCKDHAIRNYEIYYDDGYSGTNFDRPGFISMYDDIKKGLIDTVIVKDQSRFGRSYIDVGMYVEQFKEMGVKFIAVDDCYDSMQGDYDMMFPMRNVINEYYAREASKKTKTAKKAKARAGQFIGSKPPFGYKLDPEDRHHLIVDEPAAEVVRRIFTLAAQGTGYNRMTKIFRAEKVLTPIAYFNLHNPDYFKSDYWRKEFDWHVTSIKSILNNEVYLGTLVYGKERNKSMKSKKRVRNPREEWIVVENCHEPIITQEMWDRVHKILSTKHRPIKSGEIQMFAGLLYCADCGHALTYSQKQRVDGSYHGSYSCWMYKTHGKEYCTSHYITFDDVYSVVLADIQRVIRSYNYDPEMFRKILSERCSSTSDKKIAALTEECEHKAARISEIDKVLNKLYEDNALGKIPDDRFETMLRTYGIEQDALRKALPALKAEIEQLSGQNDAADKFINVIKKYTYLNDLNAEILNALIDRITVHSKETGSDGKEYRQIEISYRFIGWFDMPGNKGKAA